jgi:hypothetical protein
MSSGEATVNADGSTSYDDTPPPTDTGSGEDFEDSSSMDDETVKEVVQGIDPAVYFLVAVIIVAVLYYLFVFRKKSSSETDGFFANLDGEKVSGVPFSLVDGVLVYDYEHSRRYTHPCFVRVL